MWCHEDVQTERKARQQNTGINKRARRVKDKGETREMFISCFEWAEFGTECRSECPWAALSLADHMIFVLPPGTAGEDGLYPGCHHRSEEIWWPTPRGGILWHTAWHRHRGNLLFSDSLIQEKLAFTGKMKTWLSDAPVFTCFMNLHMWE